MGKKDYDRQRPNVFWMRQLGAEVITVKNGNKTLKDAINSALQDWMTNMDNSHYLMGTVAGPHPYPMMVRDFQSIIGKEVKEQLKQYKHKLPDYLVACVGGGSNAIGLFTEFIPHKQVKLIGVEAGGKGINTQKHASRFSGKKFLLA